MSFPLPLVGSLVAILGSFAPQEPPTYRVRVLQDPPAGIATQPLAINDSGLATGSHFDNSTGYFDGVHWDAQGVPTTLSVGHSIFGGSGAGIESDGTILGSGALSTAEVAHGLVLNPDGSFQLLPSLAGSTGVISIAFDRNQGGTIVGRSALVPFYSWISVPNEAVLWQGGAIQGLGTLGGFFAQATRINDAGLVIGSSNTAGSDFARGFVWDPSGGMREILPAEPGGTGQVMDLTEGGRICGRVTVGGTERASVWEAPDGPPTLLPWLAGDLSTSARAFGTGGVLVGSARRSPEDSSARLWTSAGVYDLDELLEFPLASPLAEAIDINASGEILAQTRFEVPTGYLNVVLTPISALSSPDSAISLAQGGTQELRIDAGSHFAGHTYRLLGSDRGTQPGQTLGGMQVPLNPGPYFTKTLTSIDPRPLQGTHGILDAKGRASARVAFSPIDSELAGTNLHHAFVVLDPQDPKKVVFVSNALEVVLAP